MCADTDAHANSGIEDAMIGSLFLDPVTAGPLWARWWVAANQPDRHGFRLARVRVGDRAAPVIWREQAISPFAILSTVERANHTAKHSDDGDGPTARRPVLLVPPIAGGFPFLLRDVAATLVADRAVHIIEWINPRRIPETAGPFGLDEQVDTIVAAAGMVDEEAHWLAVCQAGPATLIGAAIAPEQPLSVSLIGSPIDVSRAASPIAKLIRSRPFDYYRGQILRRPAGRCVYPAESQRAALYGTLASQSPDEHELARLVRRDSGSDPRAAPFLELVTSLMDQPAELYLETLQRMFLAPEGPCAGFTYRGRGADPKVLRRTPLLTLEGEKDLIAAPGQTAAAHDLVPGARAVPRRAEVVSGVGHFGLFYGEGWRTGAAPRLKEFLNAVEADLEAGDRATGRDGAR